MRLAPLDMYAESGLAKRCVTSRSETTYRSYSWISWLLWSQPIPILDDLDEQLCIPGSDASSPASLELPMGAVKRSRGWGYNEDAVTQIDEWHVGLNTGIQYDTIYNKVDQHTYDIGYIFFVPNMWGKSLHVAGGFKWHIQNHLGADKATRSNKWNVLSSKQDTETSWQFVFWDSVHVDSQQLQ